MSRTDDRIDTWNDGSPGADSMSLAAMSDAELMDAIARNVESAFEAIYDRYASTLFAVCFRILRNEFEAREVLSEVFLELWDKASRYDAERGSIRAFLVTLARCRAIDRLRSTTSKTHNQSRLREIWHATSSRRNESFAPHDHLERDEEKSILRDAMGCLNELQLQVLSLAYFEGLTHSEIALSLKIPLGTAKTAIRRGIATLRTAISGLINREVDQ